MHEQIQRAYEVALKGAWNHPFFLIPLGHCEWHEGDPERVKTMALHSRIVGTSARDAKPEINLYINTEWIRGIPDDEVFGVLCHEILHSMLRHHERAGGKKPESWAKATDMAINASLVQSGIKIPAAGLLPPRENFDDAAEEIYTLIESGEIDQPKQYDPNKVGQGCMPEKHDPNAGEKPSDEPGEGSGSGSGEGEGEGEGEGSGQGEGQGEDSGAAGEGNGDRVWGEMIAQSQVHARGTGAAKVMARIFAHKPTKAKWDRLLKRTASRANAKGGRDQQTWSKVNRRSGDIILPGWTSNRPSIAAIIDSSGSVSDEMLRSALSSVKECARISGVRVFLAVHAYSCYYADWIKPETTVEQISKLCTDRGGTDPVEAFERVGEAKGKFDACVYLTDGEVGAYPAKPDNVKRMIVGVLGDGHYRAKIPDSWQEVPVDIDGEIKD